MATTMTRILVVAVAALALVGTVEAGTLRAHVDGPFVIGDQLFSGGVLELRVVGQGSLVQISVDGRPVAIAFRSSLADGMLAANSSIAFRRDTRGYLHMVGLDYAAANTKDTRQAPMLLSSVARGLATVTPYGRTGEQSAQAN